LPHTPTPQSPIPNPQSPFNINLKYLYLRLNNNIIFYSKLN